MIHLQRVKKSTEIKQLAELAEEIWNEYFPPIIGQAQVDYMLEKFQSEGVVKQQITLGYEYFFIVLDNLPIGYIGLLQDRSNLCVELSKFYIRSSKRHRGFGNSALTLLAQELLLPEMNKIRLRVNKNNSIAINAYQKYGFILVAASVADIGNEYFMDDYIFEKTLLKSCNYSA